MQPTKKPIGIYVNYTSLNVAPLVPTKSTRGSAGYDLYSREEVLIPANSVQRVGTGLFMEIPENFYMEISTRSGMACKDIVVNNSPGIVDSDYRGEIAVILRNNTDKTYRVKIGDRIAQATFKQSINVVFNNIPSFNSDTERGQGGFGSTGA